MVTHISQSPEATMALGEMVGRRAKAGWVIGLKGDLGAGKTQFVRGLVRGLAVESENGEGAKKDRVHSPTFALVNEYRSGRLPVYHLDLYRLETAGAMESAGLEEYFAQRDGVTVIEWFERLEGLGRGEIATIVFNFEVTGDNDRKIDEYQRE